MQNNIVITAVAISTAVGLDTATSCASVRAGIVRFTETMFENSDYEPYVMAVIPDNCLPLEEIENIASFTQQERRLVRILALTSEEISQWKFDGKIPFILGLPQNEEINISSLKKKLKCVMKTKDNDSKMTSIHIIAKGRSAGLLAVQEACNILKSHKAEIVMAGGCDSYYDLDILKSLDSQSRLRSEMNLDYFIPGEGVGIICLTTEMHAIRNRMPILAILEDSASGFEEGHLYSEIPYKGEGLSNTFKKLFNNYEGERIRTIFSGMNGEGIWAKELGVSCIRHKNNFAENFLIEHPADCYGDIGAASGIVMIGQAITGMQKEYVNAPILVYTSSDHGNRCAVILNMKKKHG